MGRIRSNINIDEVINYWTNEGNYIFKNKPRILFILKHFNSECFCCGDNRGNLEKAHIIPVSSGGSDEIQNIHILCKSCHIRTESITDIPVFGKELYFRLIEEHPDLGFTRQNIQLDLVEKNKDECCKYYK
jgi:hypothetical protein